MANRVNFIRYESLIQSAVRKIRMFKGRQLLVTFALSTVIVAMLTLPAMAYTIDGCLDDWGV
ncbi:hypothetical protein C5S36_12895 [Candidatus Methanophagaceae archaeon]|nr:hypothetical protein C5S36_12895 [Methanophagales archaeon]